MHTSGLQIQMLGDLTVRRDGRPLPLPPSKKTRGLLAYLAMNPRSFRRDYLCELLWEIPDDPRGSLRWSLSKIRKLVDGEGRPRIIADRNHIRLDTAGIDIDVNHLLATGGQSLESLPTDTLVRLTETHDGQFLSGLELTNFLEFHTWCVGVREKVAAARGNLLKELIHRLRATPAKALPHARALALNAPYDEDVRADLIRLLVAAGRKEEAEQQFQLGMRMLEELGVSPTGALFNARRGPVAEPQTRPSIDATPPPRQPPPTRTIGREPELDSIRAVITGVRDRRHPGFVLVEGAPGIGKTHFLKQVEDLGRQEGFRIMGGQALEFETLRPFSLWLEAMAGTPDFEEKLLSDDNRENRETLLRTLGDSLASLSDTPVMMLFDDIQWCDESSAAALGYVAGANRNQPLLVVLAGRGSELADNSPLQTLIRQLHSARMLEECRLAPLADEAIKTIIRDYAPQLDADTLSHQCGGNPLLAIELARAVASGDSSASLDRMIRSRLERFPLPVVELLRWASVLGQRIDVDSLVRVSGSDLESIGEMLHQAEQQGLLVPLENGFQFSHDLVAKSIYNDISPTRQKVMHHKIARLLETNAALNLDFAADLAHHAALSGDSALATRAAVMAGKLCLRFFAYQDALNLYHKGTQLAGDLNDAERIRLLLELHEIRLTAAPLDDWEAAATEYAKLAEQALDHGEVAHARLGYTMASYLRWSHGQWDWAREQSLQAERITRGGSEEEQIVGMAEAARCLAMLERDLSRADAMLMEATSLAERRRIKVQAIPATRGMLHYYSSNWDEAEEAFREARTLAKTAGDRINEFQAIEYLVMLDIERGSYSEARAHSDDLLALGEKLREGSEGPFARALAGLCSYALDGIADSLDAALVELREVDARHRLAYTQNRAALLDLAAGRPASAAERAREALACAGVLERATEMLMARLTLCEAYRDLGEECAGEDEQRIASGMDLVRLASWARRRADELLPEATGS